MKSRKSVGHTGNGQDFRHNLEEKKTTLRKV